LLVGAITSFFAGKHRKRRLFLKMAALTFLILFALFGRFVAMKYFPDNIYLIALSGVRGELLTKMAENRAAAATGEKIPMRI